MKCLNCGKEMTNYDVHTFLHKCAYDVCDACGGLWLDKGELDQLAYHEKEDTFRVESIEHCSKEEVEGPASRKKCPRCEGLQLYNVGFLGQKDIVLEKCINCGGFWLDGGQFEKIEAELKKIYHGAVLDNPISAFLMHAHQPRFYTSVKRDSSETDFSVPVLPVRHAKLINKTDEKCPTCDNFLDVYKAYGMKIKSCSKCHGMWLDKGELRELRNKVADEMGENLRWMNDEIKDIEKTHAWASNKACPVCKDSLLLSTYFSNSEMIVDWCKNCHGIWLGYEDFEAIRQFQKYEFDKMSSKEMEQKVEEALKKIWTDPSESKVSEALDAFSAISALSFLSVYEHPQLLKMLLGVGITGRPIY